MAERPWAKRLDKSTRNAVLWVATNFPEIEAWRETLAQIERDKLNHPTNLKRKFEAASRVSAKDPAAPKKETKAEALTRENQELWSKVQRLERERSDGGSLFDLNASTPWEIARCIVEGMSEGRLKALQAAIAEIKAKRKAALKAQAG